jgi:hypothetical protein
MSTTSRAWTWEELDAILGSMEELQATKVLDLARRLRPDLTPEDVRNPHDFPELNDTDWHYEDGVLTGIQGVRTALRARARDRDRDEGAASAEDTKDTGDGRDRGGDG